MYFSEEWLQNALAAIDDEEKRLELKVLFITSVSDLLIDKSFELAREMHEEGRQKQDAGLQAFGFLYTALYHKFKGNQELSAEAFRSAEALQEDLKPSFISSVVCQMIAFEYWALGQRDKAFEIAFRGMRIAEITDGEGKGWAGFQLGVFYFDLKDYETSMRYFRESEEQAERLGLTYQLARTRSGIGSIYIAQNEFERGEHYNSLALEGYRQCGHLTAMSRSMNDLGVICSRRGEFEKAESYLREALEIRERLNYTPGITTSRMELGQVLMNMGRLDESHAVLLDALQLCEVTLSKQKIAQCHLLLSELCKKKEDPWKALDHLEKHFSVKSEVAGEEASNRVQHLQQKYATEKSEQEAEIHRLKNVELKKAYDLIEEKNKSILDSINYAQRIQYALLAHSALLASGLGEYFILFRPKDIVSGDFYWAARNEDSFFLAACDSTGHGVPGAFMSLLNSSYLNEAVNEKKITAPSRILDHVRGQLINSISDNEQKDGMDCTLIRIDKNSNTIAYAAAHNEPVLIRNGEIREGKADKMPVGRSEKQSPFTSYSLEIQKGDMLYLFTDGYADQFGGEKGKKLKHKNLLRLLAETSKSETAEQHSFLENRHLEWKGKLEQLDDILVIGIRF